MTTVYGKQALAHLEPHCYDAMDDDQQVCVAHEDCDGKVDHKRRMYIKRVGDSWLFHCHNCGLSGFYADRDTSVRRMSGGSLTYKAVAAPKTYSYISARWADMSVEAQLWLSSYGFGEYLVDKYAISEMEGSVALPVYADHKLAGYQFRRLFGKGPKYITQTSASLSFINNVSDTVVLTEDLLSSYKVHEAGAASVCLLGTSLKASIAHLGKSYKYAIVWLDGDSAGYAASLNIARECGPFFKGGVSVLTGRFSSDVSEYIQPKEIPVEQLREIINGH